MVRNADSTENVIGSGWPGGQDARWIGGKGTGRFLSPGREVAESEGTAEPQRSPRAQRTIYGCCGGGSTDTPMRQYVWRAYPGAAAHTRPWASTGFRPNNAGFGSLNIDECIQLTTLAPLGVQSLPAGSYYLLQDLLYRAVALTNSSGQIVEAYDTDAYGNTLIFTGPGADGLWFTDDDVQSDYGANNIIYCGYSYDSESQLYYVRNRTYNPGLGRWIQRDPIGYEGGINLYEYVGGATLGWADPDGAVAIPIPRAPASAIVEAIVVAALVAYFYYLAHRRTNVRCQPANVDRDSPCSFSDCSAGRLCGVVGSGRSCQWRPMLRGGRVCGCQAGGSDDER